MLLEGSYFTLLLSDTASAACLRFLLSLDNWTFPSSAYLSEADRSI
jgi:hypothetical protein